MLCASATNRRFGAVLLIVGLFAGASHGGDDAAGDRAQLDAVIEALDANAQRIETWRGEAAIREEIVARRPGEQEAESEQIERSSMSFILDDSRQALRTRREVAKPYTLIDRDGEEQAAGEGDFVIHQMIRHGALYKRQEVPEAISTGRPRIDISDAPAVRGRSRSSAVHHPKWLFLAPTGPKLTTLLSDLQRSEGALAVTTDGDAVTVELTRGSTTNRYVFDLASGGNLVSYVGRLNVADGPDRYTHIDIEYEARDGIYLPVRYTKKTQGMSTSGAIITTSTDITLTTTALNAAVLEAEFTLDAMGAEPGDPVVDNRTGVTFQYGEERGR